MPSRTVNLSVKRGSTRTITMDLYENDGSTQVVAAATDQVRFKIWQTGGAAPDLDLSDSVTANGSRAWISANGVADTTPATASIKIAQDDTLDLDAGLYNWELGFIDDSETSPADAYTVVAYGKLRIVETSLGDRGKAS